MRQRRSAPQEPRKRPETLAAVEKVLPAVLSKLGFEKRLKEHTLLDLAYQSLPPPIRKRAKPVFIDMQKNLVLAAADAATAQELSMLRAKLLAVLAPCAASLGLDLLGLRVDMKSFHRIKMQEECAKEEEPMLATLEENELRQLDLSQKDEEQVAEFVSGLEAAACAGQKALEPEIKKKMIRAYESQLRLISWRKERGYPCCTACGLPVRGLYESAQNKLCLNCKSNLKQNLEKNQ